MYIVIQRGEAERFDTAPIVKWIFGEADLEAEITRLENIEDGKSYMILQVDKLYSFLTNDRERFKIDWKDNSKSYIKPL